MLASMSANSMLPADFTITLTNSLLNQPTPLAIQSTRTAPSATIVRPRQENLATDGAYVDRQPLLTTTHSTSPTIMSRKSSSSHHCSSGLDVAGVGLSMGTTVASNNVSKVANVLPPFPTNLHAPERDQHRGSPLEHQSPSLGPVYAPMA
jgi:hypothetical protein